MAEKKDLLDYLRNQQKAAEIESKVNGVNVWVLIGALGVVGWQLITYLPDVVWSRDEWLLRALTAAVALNLCLSVFVRSDRLRDDVRHSRLNLGETEVPLLVLLYGLLIFCPPFLLFYLFDRGWDSGLLAVFGIACVSIAAFELYKNIFPDSKEVLLPHINLNSSNSSYVFLEFVVCGLLIWIIYEQFLFFFLSREQIGLNSVKALVLITTFYCLLLLIIARKNHNDNNTSWTYEIEMELVLGLISPDVAVRKIENRRLGLRVEDVLNDFFEKLDKDFRGLDKIIEDSKDAIAKARLIPQEYQVERKVQIANACSQVNARIVEIENSLEEFLKYMKRLKAQSAGRRFKTLNAILESQNSRYENYKEQLSVTKEVINSL